MLKTKLDEVYNYLCINADNISNNALLNKIVFPASYSWSATCEAYWTFRVQHGTHVAEAIISQSGCCPLSRPQPD